MIPVSISPAPAGNPASIEAAEPIAPETATTNADAAPSIASSDPVARFGALYGFHPVVQQFTQPSQAGSANAVASAVRSFVAGVAVAGAHPGPVIPARVATAAQNAAAAANPTDAQRARNALSAVGAPPASHPRMQHANHIEAQLTKEGLPTNADGIHIYVVGDNTQDHGPMVVRTIAGPAGLAKGAEIELSEKMPDPAVEKMTVEEKMDHDARVLGAITGSASSEDLRAWAIDALEAAYLQPKAELDYLVAHAPVDARTKIVNMSWGQSEDALVATATKAALANPDSPLIAELDARRAELGKPVLDLTRREAHEELRHVIAGHIHAALAAPEGARRLKSARAAATEAVAKAREAGFLPIAASGNFFEQTRHGEHSRGTTNLVATIPGVLSVGSVEIGDMKKKGDEKMGNGSSVGADVSAPGVDVPVGIDKSTRGPKDVSGTSFAAPYVASVAALMIKANPNITPAEIEKILQSGAVATDVKGTQRDGAGVIDPVVAVRAAKALAKFDGAAFHTSHDLDPSTKRAAHDALRALLPTTTPAYKSAINLINADNFVELDVATQKNLLEGLVAQKADPKIAAQVTMLVDSKEFHELGPAARASFAKSFASLDANDRADALKLLGRPELSKLPPQVKDALVAAAGKTPGDTGITDSLLQKANEPGFKKLAVDVQASFFKAFEHQNDAIEMEAQTLNKERLLKLVDSGDFKKLGASDQRKWLQAMANPDAAVRDRAYERIQNSWDNAGKDDEATRVGELHRRAGALDGPDTVRTDRVELPGASKDEPQISVAKSDRRSVFFRADGKGIDPRPRDVLVHTVTIEGQDIEVIFPKPMPKDVPSVELIAKSLAGLPGSERSHVQQVIVDPAFKSFMQATSAKEGRPNRVFMGGEVPDTPREMTAMLSHEAAHLLSADVWGADPAKRKQWEAAIASDDHWVSDYATRHLQEDVAETVALYFQVKGTPDEAVMKREFPGRYALLEELLGN